MAKNNNLGDFLTDVANAIRTKKGTTGTINAQNFSSEIASISTLPAGVSVNGTEITIDTDQYTAVIAGQDGDDQTGKVVIRGLEIPVELDPNTDSSVQVTNLTATNVKKDVTILGVTGTLESAKEEETKTLVLSMASGDQVITPTNGKVLSQVTITKPSTMTAENIKKDINIGGVVGTLESTLPNGVSINGTEITIDTDLYTAVIAGQDGDDQTGKVVISGLNIPVELNTNTDSSVQVTNLTPGNVKKDVTILGVTGTLESGGGTTLKGLLDLTKSTAYLFSKYSGSTIPDGAIEYSDTSNVTNMSNMFSQCTNLTAPILLDTNNVTITSSMFYGCTNLTSIPQLDTSKVTDMFNMFRDCSSLTTIPLLNTSNANDMRNVFHNCTNLTSIPQLDTSNVTNMYSMFRNCSSLTTIPQLNTSKVTNMQSMFYQCSSLTEVPLLNTSNVTNMQAMFGSCSNLKSILMTNIGVNLDISASTKFERSDLLVILNNLATVTTSKTLTMGVTNLAKLTDEDKAIATNKGWTLA